MNIRSTLSLFASLVLAYSAALIGTLFTTGSITTWYASLVKPELNPPNWLFGPVWAILYALMAIAAWRIYEKRKSNREANHLLLVYMTHLGVNAFWSIAFFGFHDPILGSVVIAVLWFLIAYLTRRFYKFDVIAGYLFLPYLAWVSFATYLNLAIVLLN